jgi:hypothetical protein
MSRPGSFVPRTFHAGTSLRHPKNNQCEGHTACGFKLANDRVDTRSLQAYLGHRNIQNTTRYTALAPDRFKGFWRD